jgi:hypothetical protein
MAADLSPAERSAIGAMWDFRARAEHGTAAHYEDLGRRLRAAGAAATMIERVTAAHADELRHQELCTRMAERWGHPSSPLAPAKLQRIAPHDLDGGARLAYEMVALFCVSESINATLLLRSWQKAEHAETRAILHELLADEVRHSQIGWAYVSSLPGWRDDIASRMPRMLAATTHDEHFLDEPSPRGSRRSSRARSSAPPLAHRGPRHLRVQSYHY